MALKFDELFDLIKKDGLNINPLTHYITQPYPNNNTYMKVSELSNDLIKYIRENPISEKKCDKVKEYFSNIKNYVAANFLDINNIFTFSLTSDDSWNHNDFSNRIMLLIHLYKRGHSFKRGLLKISEKNILNISKYSIIAYLRSITIPDDNFCSATYPYYQNTSISLIYKDIKSLKAFIKIMDDIIDAAKENKYKFKALMFPRAFYTATRNFHLNEKLNNKIIYNEVAIEQLNNYFLSKFKYDELESLLKKFGNFYKLHISERERKEKEKRKKQENDKTL